MKHLCLLRHAKSSWDDLSLSDADRPLAARGRRAAPQMGAHMRESLLLPEFALCSPARRAVETWDLVAGELGHDPVIEMPPDMYESDPMQMLALVRNIDNLYSSAILIGHNPGLHELATRLIETETSPRIFGKFPTASLAVFEISVERWEDIRPGCGRLTTFIRPSELKGT